MKGFHKDNIQALAMLYLDDGLKKDSPFELAPKKLQPPMQPQLPATVLLMLVTDLGQRNHSLKLGKLCHFCSSRVSHHNSKYTCVFCGRVSARTDAV